jgi:hypothetical protein
LFPSVNPNRDNKETDDIYKVNNPAL